MKNNYSINTFVDVVTREDVLLQLKKRFISRRKELKTTQKELSLRTGVSYASIRRFESIGEISLSSLLKLAEAINCLEDFNKLFENQIITNLKDYKV